LPFIVIPPIVWIAKKILMGLNHGNKAKKAMGIERR
jgi:hypothetical protein